MLEEHSTATGVPECVLKRCKCWVFFFEKCVYYILTMPRKCLNHPDTFFYMCGELTFKFQKQNFTPLTRNVKSLFWVNSAWQRLKLGPSNLLCNMCRLLTGWVNGLCQMLFAIPIVGRKPKDHSSGCSFV